VVEVARPNPRGRHFLDGLCGGLALIALIPLGLLAALNGHIGAMAMMFIMAAAVLGFLRYNWNPARIFLGDTGSMILGFFIAAAATQTTGRRAILGALLLPIAVAGVPLLDVLLAIWRRSVRNLLNQWSGGESIGVFAPDKDHLHHRFLAEGNGQVKVTRLLHALAFILSAFAFLPMIFGDQVIGISLIGLMIILLVGLRNFARIELVQSGSALHLALKRPGGKRGLRLAAFLYDSLALAGCAALPFWLEKDRIEGGFSQLECFQFTVMFAVLGTIGIFLSKAYRRVWSRATLRDLAGVIVCIAAAGVLSGSFFTMVQQDISFATLRVSLMATCLAMLVVPLPRCSVELLRELAVDAGHRRFEKAGVTTDRHVMVYGAGDLGNLFIDYLKTCPPAHFKNFRVVGFIDESVNLKRRIMRGFTVMGDLELLDALAQKQQLHGVIVTISNPDPERLAKLREIAERRGLNIYSWCFDLTPQVIDINRPAVDYMASRAHDSVIKKVGPADLEILS
jgi:UDP-GlcNAc:undecaprenyl-phosphate GlcNAc-1-phosphate transferase